MAEHKPGMGAIFLDEGVAFRVWAPNADAVFVTGEFNEWSKDANALVREDSGHWYGEVPEAQVGHEYQYIIHNGDQELYRVDPMARQVTNSVGNAVIYDPNSYDWGDDNFETPFLNEIVIYEMHVGSFMTEGDGPGNLEIVREHLDHLSRLGVNVLELMPVMEFAGDYSWGYNPAHIFAVESAYGGPDALKDLVKAAHERGIAVIVDVVYNHFGPSDLDLWRFDGWSENDKGGIYFFNDWRSSTPWGDTRPDYGRQEVRNFIHDNAMMWLREYRVDGLRYDMTPYMRSVDATETNIPEGWTLCRWINNDIRVQFPRALVIAEDLHGKHEVTDTFEGGGAFHAQWDGKFVHPIRAAVVTSADEARDMNAVRNAVLHNYGDAFERVIYTESHDEVANGRARVPQEINQGDPTGWHARKRSTLGAALAFTAPGVPMLFQGQEFLEGEWFRDDVPLDWDKNADFRGIVRFYRDLVALRLNRRGTTAGLTGQGAADLHTHDANNVFIFHRWRDGGPGDDVVVVANFDSDSWGDYTIPMPHAGHWKLELNSDATVYSADYEGTEVFDVEATDEPYDDYPASATVTLPPYSVLIYSRS